MTASRRYASGTGSPLKLAAPYHGATTLDIDQSTALPIILDIVRNLTCSMMQMWRTSYAICNTSWLCKSSQSHRKASSRGPSCLLTGPAEAMHQERRRRYGLVRLDADLVSPHPTGSLPRFLDDRYLGRPVDTVYFIGRRV